MIILKIVNKHPKYHFFNIFGPFFGPKSGFEEKIVNKNWQGPLAIKTTKSQLYTFFKTFFSQKAQTFPRGIFLFFIVLCSKNTKQIYKRFWVGHDRPVW